MAEKKEKKVNIPSTVNEALTAIATALGVAVTELWIIFVRQYVVRGLAYLFTAIVLVGLTVFLYQFIALFVLIIFALSMPFFYGAILTLGNPRYYAISDILKKVKEFKETEKRSYTSW